MALDAKKVTRCVSGDEVVHGPEFSEFSKINFCNYLFGSILVASNSEVKFEPGPYSVFDDLIPIKH